MYAKVIYIQVGRVEPPWDLWGRIFQWLGPAPSVLGRQGPAPSVLGRQGPVPSVLGRQGPPPTGQRWRLFWFPAPNKRVMPTEGEVGPAHLNGGYTFPCKSDCIVVYRHEEATRVLLHEILHAACLDPPADLPLKEATTETWAELYLVALCSGGSLKKAAELWAIQSQWISNQNSKLKIHYSIEGPEHYAWRYTVGRELILRSLKIELPEPKASRSRSLRLTSPDLL